MHNLTKHKKPPESYLRVTQVISPYKDFSSIPQEVVLEASLRGEEVHRLAYLYANNILIEKPAEYVKNYFFSFKEWFDTYVEEVILSEERISCDKLMLTGCPDLVVRIKGSKDLVLVDLKTPQVHCKTWRPQTAAYKMLLRDVLGVNCERRLVVMPRKDGSKAVVKEHLKHELDEKIFMNLLSNYRFFHDTISFS